MKQFNKAFFTTLLALATILAQGSRSEHCQNASWFGALSIVCGLGAGAAITFVAYSPILAIPLATLMGYSFLCFISSSANEVVSAYHAQGTEDAEITVRVRDVTMSPVAPGNQELPTEPESEPEPVGAPAVLTEAGPEVEPELEPVGAPAVVTEVEPESEPV